MRTSVKRNVQRPQILKEEIKSAPMHVCTSIARMNKTNCYNDQNTNETYILGAASVKEGHERRGSRFHRNSECRFPYDNKKI